MISASAHEARLRCYELQVRPITIAARFAQREGAPVNVLGKGIVHTHFKPDARDRRSDFRHQGAPPLQNRDVGVASCRSRMAAPGTRPVRLRLLADRRRRVFRAGEALSKDILVGRTVQRARRCELM